VQTWLVGSNRGAEAAARAAGDGEGRRAGTCACAYSLRHRRRRRNGGSATNDPLALRRRRGGEGASLVLIGKIGQSGGGDGGERQCGAALPPRYRRRTPTHGLQVHVRRMPYFR